MGNSRVKPRYVFHGGCLKCCSQQKNGVNYCKKCRYFIADWSLPSLMIEWHDGEEEEYVIDLVRKCVAAGIKVTL